MGAVALAVAPISERAVMTLLDDFKKFVSDAEAGAQFKKWKHDNPGEYSRWASFRDAILAGGSPTPPTMLTPHGRELIDAGVMYLDENSQPTPPATTTAYGEGEYDKETYGE